MTVLGIDIGGSGIKGAPVDIEAGRLLTDRFRIPTPPNATPEAVIDIVDKIRVYFDWAGPVGCTVPARVENGLVRTATNIHSDWVNTQIDDLMQQKMGCAVAIVNDADAAGLASMRFGAGRHTSGVVLFLTIGTGIGSALFMDGVLIPNTEFGHLMIHGDTIEKYASARTRYLENLSWPEWAGRFQEVLDRVEFLLAPNFIILGGGVSRPYKTVEFMPHLNTHADLLIETLENEAGIVGAAVLAGSLDSR